MAKMKKNINEAKEALDELLFASRDFTDEAQKAAKAVFGIGTQARATTKAFRDIASSVSDIDNLLDDVLDGTKTIYDLNKEAQKFDEKKKKYLTEYGIALSAVGATTEDINKFKQGSLTIDQLMLNAGIQRGSIEEDLIMTYERQREVMEDTSTEMGDMADHAKKVEKNFGMMGSGLSGVEGIMKKMGMGDLSDKLGFDDAIKGGRQMSAEMVKSGKSAGGIGSKLKIAGKMGGMMAKSLMASLGPVTLIAAAISFIVDSFMKLDKLSGEVANNFGVSYNEGKDLAMEMNDLSLSTTDLDANMENLVKSQLDMNKALGTSVQFTDKQVQDYNKIAHRLKLSGEAMDFYQKNGIKSGKGIKESLRDVANTTMDLKARSGIMLNLKDVEEDVAKISANQLLTHKGDLAAITEMVFKAKQYGYTMEGLESTAAGLLDFETSIANELKAELLTGKDLNLEKARQYAMDNDMVGLAEELNRQGFTANEWANMNYRQREAAAAAMNMSIDQMAEVINKEATLQKLKEQGQNDISKGQEYYNKLIEQGMTKDEAAAEMKKAGMQDALDAQIASETKAETMEAFWKKISDLGVMLANMLMPVMDYLMEILPGILSAMKPIMTVLGLIVDWQLRYIKPFWDGIVNLLKYVKDIFVGIGEVAYGIFSGDGGMIMNGLKKIGGSIVKILLLPFQYIVDVFVGIVNFLIKGANAILEYIPGTSYIDAWESPSLAGMIGLEEGGVVTEPTNALIGEGGEPEAVVPLSKAGDMGFGGGESTQILKQILTSIKAGGTVTLNGQKVGEALAKYNYSTQ